MTQAFRSSVVGLGCNNFGRRLDLEGTRAVVDAALDAGVTFFDTADIYGGAGRSEELLGKALDGRRDQVVLATKFGMDMGRWALSAAAPASTSSARRGFVAATPDRRDRLLLAASAGSETPIAETLETLDELVHAGSVRAIGASNFNVAQIEEADATARERGLTRFTAIQNEYSLLSRQAERDVLPACERLGLGFVPYFPLASGLLTGKYRRGEPGPEGARLSGREQLGSDQQFATVEALQRFADERGVTMVQVAIGALLARPVVSSVIAGATRPDQVEANAAAAAWTPSEDDLAELRSLLG